MDHAGGMRITELAVRTGTTTRALRYYEEIGLVVPGRTGGRARLYDLKVYRRVQQIVRLRQAGLSTRDIAGLLAQRNDGDIDRAQLKDLLAQQLSRLDAQRRLLEDEINQLA